VQAKLKNIYADVQSTETFYVLILSLSMLYLQCPWAAFRSDKNSFCEKKKIYTLEEQECCQPEKSLSPPNASGILI
jgi:hypothetical protein